jgi:hypothetical protein
MAASQAGTGGLTLGGQATQAALHITIPANAIVESVDFSPGGSPDFEDYQDADGAFHTRVTFESGMDTATVTLFGAAYTTAAATLDGSGSNYYVESNQRSFTRGPVRSVVNVTKIPTVV